MAPARPLDTRAHPAQGWQAGYPTRKPPPPASAAHLGPGLLPGPTLFPEA